MNERSILTIVVVVLALIGGYAVCDKSFDDDDPGGMGAPGSVYDLP